MPLIRRPDLPPLPETKKLTFKLTADDFAKGTPGDCRRCVISQALYRLTGRPVIETDCSLVAGAFTAFGDSEEPYNRLNIEPNHKAAQVIKDFDREEETASQLYSKYKDQEFEVNIPLMDNPWAKELH